MVFKEEIVDMKATAVMSPEGIDWMDSLTFTFADGKMAILHGNMIAQTDCDTIIFGTKGCMKLVNTNNYQEIQIFGGSREVLAAYKVPEQISGFEYEVLACKKAIEEGKNNYISMSDMLVMYQKLMNHEILNDELCEVALEILCRQRWQDDIMRYIYEPVTFAHKTGSLDYRNLDVGVMMVNNEKYFIGISVKSVNIDGNQQLIGKLGRMIYDAIIQGDLC